MAHRSDGTSRSECSLVEPCYGVSLHVPPSHIPGCSGGKWLSHRFPLILTADAPPGGWSQDDTIVE